MDNPYISRGPVQNPALFFGRNDQLNEIAAFLRGNQSISLIGPRKIGKTSLLFHLMRPTTWPTLGLNDDNLFVYLDCEVLGEGSHADIFGQFAWEMEAALDERGLPAEPALQRALNKPSRLSFEGAVRKLNQRSLRVILILDEFERLSTNADLDINFFNALRSAAGRYQLAFLTASAKPLIQLTYASRSQDILSSPFFNIFAPIFPNLMAPVEARQLIEQPAHQAKTPFSAETVDFLFDFAGGHPFLLQVAAFHAFEVYANTTNSTSDIPIANLHAEIEQRASRELQAHFEYYWQNLSEREQAMLCQLSDLTPQVESDTTMRGLLRDLSQKCLLVKDGNHYHYSSLAWEKFVALQAVRTTVIAAAGNLIPQSGDTLSNTSNLVGTQLGPYQVLEQIGRGGMSEVYRGHHLRLGRDVALKILPADLASEADFRLRFEREARAVARLRHPNIVQVFDFGDVVGVYYMAIEYIPGQNLTQYMQQSGPLILDQACPLLTDLAQALDHAHAQGLIHRDVKPSNILLQPLTETENQPYRAILTDFGIAKMRSGSLGTTQTGMLMGTLDYMAPEQINAAKDVDGRADVYALGVITFQLLTGERPFTGDNPGAILMAHLQDPIPDPRQYIPALPAPTAEVIMQALAKVPSDRFQTAGAFVRALS